MNIRSLRGNRLLAMMLMATLPPLHREERQPDPKEPPEPHQTIEAQPITIAGTVSPTIQTLATVSTLHQEAIPGVLYPPAQVVPICITPISPTVPRQRTEEEPGPHQHSTIGPSKVCRECGQKLSGAELREVRTRQAKVDGRYANQRMSPWDHAKYPTHQERRMAYEKAMKRAGARGV